MAARADVPVIDRLVGWLNPRAGLQRHAHRAALTRAYEAASPGDGWKPRRAGASANADHLADSLTLRTKARALVQNVPYIRAALDGLVAATVGTGIIPRSTGREADKANKLLAAWFKQCDADGRLDYYGIVAAADRALEQDGECLVRLRPRRPSDGLVVPLQLQLLEVDWIDSGKTAVEGGNQVINGIEYDVLGAVVAYWLFDVHPGDNIVSGAARLVRTRNQSHRVPAEAVIHLYAPERPGQGRGFTRFASVIPRVRDLQLYEDAEIARKNLESRLGIVHTGDPTSLANPAGMPPVDANEVARTGYLGELPSGGIMGIGAVGTLTAVEPKPVGGYEAYVKLNLHLIAAGIGVPYELMTGDVSETNFSSARVRLLDFRRSVEQMRWHVLIPKLLERIHVAFIDAAVLAGALRSRDYAVDYSTPKWDYVNPEQDVKADLAEISGGLSSVSEKLRQRGYDPQVVFEELAKDFDRMRELGILDVLLFKESAGKVFIDPEAAAATAKSGAAASNRAAEALGAVLDRMDTRLAGLEQRSTAVTLNAGDTHVTVPERSVTIEPAQQSIHVAPAEVRNEIRVEGPTIDVAAAVPTVHVTAQAAPPEVHVVNQVHPAAVNIPARHIVTEVERDAQGRITRTSATDKPPHAP